MLGSLLGCLLGCLLGSLLASSIAGCMLGSLLGCLLASSLARLLNFLRSVGHTKPNAAHCFCAVAFQGGVAASTLSCFPMLPPGRGWSSSKSPSTEAKVNYLVIRYLYFRSLRGGLDLCSPSTALKVNYLVIRYLYFVSVCGDLLERHVYDKRLCGYASRCQFPLFPSTKSGFLCAFRLRNPHFRAFRAQNRGFCAFLAFGTPVFWHFEYKITIFVLVY